MKPEVVESIRKTRDLVVLERLELDDALRALDALLERHGADNGATTPAPKAARAAPVAHHRAAVDAMSRIRSAPKVPGPGPLPDRILEFLDDGEERSVGVIADALDARYSTTATQLSVFVKSGKLERPRTGIYRRPQE